MQIKLNYVYLYFFLLIILLPFNLLANDNPFEYRGVKLGMSMDEISNLESVKTGFMPDPRKLECLKGQYIYNIRTQNFAQHFTKNKLIDVIVNCKILLF